MLFYLKNKIRLQYNNGDGVGVYTLHNSAILLNISLRTAKN